MLEKAVVTCFLESENKILLLRRSQKVSTYQGKWAGVSGYIEQKTADEQALIELKEETSLSPDDVQLVRKGRPLAVEDEKLGVTWLVHPYLFHIKEPARIKIDWEHKEAQWIEAADIERYQTVPRLKEALLSVLGKD